MANTEVYILSLHDALPIWIRWPHQSWREMHQGRMFSRYESITFVCCSGFERTRDRKSTRLNSSHTVISYAVFCLKKKKPNPHPTSHTPPPHPPLPPPPPPP